MIVMKKKIVETLTKTTYKNDIVRVTYFQLQPVQPNGVQLGLLSHREKGEMLPRVDQG